MIKPTRATGLENLELQRLRDRVGRLFAALQEATVAEDPLSFRCLGAASRSL